MNIILTIMLTLSALFVPAQHASQPVAEAPSFSLAPLGIAPIWASQTLADAGVDASHVTFLFQNEHNCGAALSPAQLGGCTVTMANHHYAVLISPKLAYTPWGMHILMHEMGHTLGMNECEAEDYAHTFEDVPLWSYPACRI